jgi:hypothetical protein
LQKLRHPCDITLNHRPLKTGTVFGGVLKPVAAHHKLTVKELLEKLKLN